jgi:zinc/manganese transport system substrate-binding protein
VGGDKVVVHSVMKGPESVHNVAAKPSEMVQLNQADLFVHSGLDAEPWRDNLLTGARNPRVMAGQPGNVDMSAGIVLRDIPQGRGDRSQGDMHAYGNPHYTCNPTNMQLMTATMCAALVRIDPTNADLYKRNATALVRELDRAKTELADALKPFGRVKLVTYHRAWDYLADAFGLDVVGTIEAKVGITPTPSEMRRTIELMKQQNVKIVIVETYSSFDNAKFVADAAGAKVLVLPDHVNGIDGVDSVQKLLRYNIGKIAETAKAVGIGATQ